MALVERYDTAEEVPESLKEHYVEHGEGDSKAWVLENVIGALGAKERVKEEKRQADKKLKDVEARLAEKEAKEKAHQEELDAAKKKELESSGKWEELRKLEEEKRLTDKNEHEARLTTVLDELAELKNERERDKIEKYCGTIASTIGVSGENGTIEPLKMLIEMKRTKMVDGKLVVLNSDGLAVDWSQKQLEEDVKTDPFFAHLILGSKASGGGASGGGGGAAPGKEFSDYTEQERTQLYIKSPDKFREMAAAAKNKGK